ncbi:profilin [Marchantia polymorpha subsp. ruderalis]|uniref:Profilin n=2 Tax=Marchantia polymorpha TaxID=3197 RepID=A0A176WLP3_MARPO|nr:hypothetical protein AXG93_2139s1040 [Marchantia polymorpha subsp. ruderalis]PTQ45911.1 hypothetical protein MARPO_0013s0121 [Marchantia polymorpha]BBN18935.1 hypothetical protein Mp_8g06710 [Marchantia polymorpha subsp. ruderalis]|eukprot:PTQ45911.1 hypothetical protein MARPO_0013s0121 [Marchantia polymorpha]
MSWQSYVDDHLMLEIEPGRRLVGAAIIGQDGNVWAQSAEFPELKDNEIDNVVKGMVDNGQLAQAGLYLGGLKYMVIQGEAGQQQTGVTIKRTNSALVIGIYKEPTKGPECNVIVERMGDYLIEQGI